MSVRKRESNLNTHLCLGFVMRVALIAYGQHHDRTGALKYTDVDYHVLTDGACEIRAGHSPFDRHTYRYSPLFAFILLPNLSIHFLFGKFVFSLCDILATRLIYSILQWAPPKTRVFASLLWLYNPLVIGISTRGNADSIPSLLILAMMFVLNKRLPILSGMLLGLAVHIKLYPIVYSLPIYLSFTPVKLEQSLLRRLRPNLPKVKLVAGAALGFLVPTVLSYLLYGDEYLEESFFHHFRRADTRHNFSIYFYLLYLSAEAPVSALATIAPQLMVVGGLGIRYGKQSDLAFCLFTQTVAFVTFNKVVTSQYFVWYLVLLPLVLPRISISRIKGVVLSILWLGAQASWLLPAYLLEFEGVDAFVPIWLESIAFFCCNVGILMALIAAYNSGPIIDHRINTKKCR